MKKFSLFSILNTILVSSAYATLGPSFCSSLWIDIVNQSQYECVLLQKDLIAGELHGGNTLNRIPAGNSTHEFTTISSDFTADLTLTYMCGPGMATIHIHKDACIYGGKASTYMSAIADMHADFKIYPSIYSYELNFSRGNMVLFDLPGMVKWTFSEENKN